MTCENESGYLKREQQFVENEKRVGWLFVKLRAGRLGYDLYGLTAEEIAIVEAAV